MEKSADQKSQIMAKFSDRYDAWLASQEGQTDAYEYEKSFDMFIQQASKELFQETVGEETDPRKKNDKH